MKNITRTVTRCFLFLSVIILASCITGCGESDFCVECQPGDKYFITYEVSSKSLKNEKLTIHYSEFNKTRKKKIDTNTDFKIEVGPVLKDFTASITVEGNSKDTNLQMIGKISVRKNNNAYTVRAEDNSTVKRTRMKLEHLIDY